MPRLEQRAPNGLGFSLVELLAVVAIVLILLSLLFPLMREARRRAHLAVCASNEKQMSAGFQLYIAEHDGMYPFHRRGSMESWHTEIFPYLGHNFDFFRCPARTIWESNLVPGKTYAIAVVNPLAQHFMPYGYNGAMLGLDEYRPNTWLNRSGKNRTSAGDIWQPAKMIVLSDSKISRHDAWAQSLWYANRKDNEGVADTHAGKANILFADGHVDTFMADQINEDPGFRTWWIPNPGFDPGY